MLSQGLGSNLSFYDARRNNRLPRQLFERVAVLDLVLARHQQSEDLEVSGRLCPAHPRNGLFPVLGEIPQQRANHRLAQLVTRATQSSGWVALTSGEPVNRDAIARRLGELLEPRT
jgi:hypothetical protein